jgi:tRNA pseudouridine38-40 synthase
MVPEKLRAAINGNLAPDVRVMRAEEVADDFHARYSARGKTYLYRIFNERVISPFWFRYAHRESRPLNLERMQEAARLFVGEHDWTAFSAAQTDAQTRVRHVTDLDVRALKDERSGGRLIEIEATADGFLRYMVRSVAGTLLAIGRGEMDFEVVSRAITTGERALAGDTAPACGLTLLRVNYD